MKTIERAVILSEKPPKIGYIVNVPINLKYTLYKDFLIGHNHKNIEDSTIFDILIKKPESRVKSFGGANLEYRLWNGSVLETRGVWWQSNIHVLRKVLESMKIEKQIAILDLIGLDSEYRNTFTSRFVETKWWLNQQEF